MLCSVYIKVIHPYVERFHYLIVVCNLVVKWTSKFSQFTHTILHQGVNVIIKLIIMLTLRSSSMGSSDVSASFTPRFFSLIAESCIDILMCIRKGAPENTLKNSIYLIRSLRKATNLCFLHVYQK